MTVLVTYATKMGATASIAAAIGIELRATGFQTDVVLPDLDRPRSLRRREGSRCTSNNS